MKELTKDNSVIECGEIENKGEFMAVERRIHEKVKQEWGNVGDIVITAFNKI